METKFKTSFIPKKPIATSPKPGVVVRSKKGLGFFTLLSLLVFIVTIVFGVGTYMYKFTVQKAIDNQLVNLQKAKDAFEPVFISEATRLNSRIVAANQVLNNHLSPSSIFELLEEFTLRTVSFDSFEFADNFDGTIEVTASGEGDSFRSIVLQSDEFGQSGYMRDVLFDDLQPTDVGRVSFSFNSVLDPQLVLYRKSLNPVEMEVDNDLFDVPESGPEEDDGLGVFGN
jgi:hypothetical protein